MGLSHQEAQSTPVNTTATKDPSAMMAEALNSFKNPSSVGEPTSTDIDDSIIEREEEEAASTDEVVSEDKPEEAKDDTLDVKGKKDVEEIVADGKKIQIDWNDRKSIKEMLSRVEGAKRAWSERDAALRQASKSNKELEDARAKFGESKQALDAINEAFDRGGIAGLVNLLTNDAAGYQKWFDMEYNKKKQYDTADEGTRQALDAQAELEKYKREMAFINKKNEEAANAAKAEQDRLAQLKTQTIISDAVTKNSFKGKLGDVELEKWYDDAVHDAARREIERLPDDQELTAEQVQSIFSKAADKFHSSLLKKGEEQATKAVQKAKDAAALKLNAAAKKDSRPATKKEDEYNSAVKSNNVSDKANMLMKILKGQIK